MRAADPARRALAFVACALLGEGSAPTAAELRQHAGVNARQARHTIQNMHRAGQLRPVRTRRVGYRNRPVNEYEPATPAHAAPTHPEPSALALLARLWA